MVTFSLNLIRIIAGILLLGLVYFCKKKVSKTNYDKFDLKWCSILGIISLASGVSEITNLTNMSSFVYVYYIYIILNAIFLVIIGIFIGRAFKLLINKFNKNIRR